MDGTGRLFYRQLPLLARSHRVATYALRDSATEMETLVADLDGVIENLAPAEGKAIVIGESFGGALAMSLALARPERVAALVILNSFPYFVPHVRLRLALLGLGALPWGAMRFVRRLTASRMHSAHTHREEIRRFMELTADATKQGYVNRLRVLQQYDIRERLAELRPPTLFVAAEQDHLVPAIAQARFMAARVPSAAVHVLPGHGHVCLIAPGVDLCLIMQEWRSDQHHPSEIGRAPRTPMTTHRDTETPRNP
jgi:pimeloyl-ACP methyl ester carboxylesterase